MPETVLTRTRTDGDRTAAAPPGPARRTRMAWLDGLRGLAAMVVVFEHSLDVLWPEARLAASPWFDFGRYGVFVFFLVSGYVVPASLERRGSVREFWIGRVFRLYPLWAVAALVGLGFALAGVSWGPPVPLTEHPWVSALAHLTMLQDLLGVPNVVNVFWTLSYEMVFYLLVTAMFVTGVHKASARTALGFAAAAVFLSGLAPAGLIGARERDVVVIATALLAACGLLAVMRGGRSSRQWGAVGLAVLALTLLTLGNRVGGLESLAIIATMFAGTALYRIQHGEGPRRSAMAMVALVPALTVTAGIGSAAGWGIGGLQPMAWGWPIAVLAAWLTFLVGMALRHRRVPRFLAWLGLVSYSVYLLHPLPIQIIWRVAGDPEALSLGERLAWGVFLVGSVLGAAALAYRFVERPMQNLGRGLVRAKRDKASAAGRQ
ncbi:acyltransferase family protein [Spirillospora sp. CA-294931]|uniref:acyltransferase family protein n=1 Tax=Spirillospora sp. CA-294931 TaxID=3240042 RepID=UPI003D93CC77